MGRYRAPDADARTAPFNAGRNPLGARKRADGALVVRFELPFHVWCGACNAHLAQGTRYNAHKRHAGEYLSTQVWAFRCKCVCGSWFEIRTDPQHARYVVHEGAREQNQDWDPAEHGGFAVYDTETAGRAPQSEAEFRADERKRAARLRELESLADSSGADPYARNAALRSSFRKDKRARTAQLEKDVALRDRLGWHHDRKLLPDATPRTSRRDVQSYTQQRLEAHKPCSSRPAAADLRTRLIANTRDKTDPFMQQIRRSLRTPRQ